MLQECPLGGATLDALLCSLYRLLVKLFVALHCLHLETNAGLLRDRRMVYALDHNPHITTLQYLLRHITIPFNTIQNITIPFKLEIANNVTRHF